MPPPPNFTYLGGKATTLTPTAHESAHLTDGEIRQGCVFLTARQNGTPYSSAAPPARHADNYYGNNVAEREATMSSSIRKLWCKQVPDRHGIGRKRTFRCRIPERCCFVNRGKRRSHSSIRQISKLRGPAPPDPAGTLPR